MKITYTFDTENENDREELKDVQNAKNMALLISEVRNIIFRPARKHGYPNQNIQNLVNACGNNGGPAGEELIESLEVLWSELLEEYNLKD